MHWKFDQSVFAVLRTGKLKVLVAAHFGIGLITGLMMLHDQLTSQVNWVCPPGTYGDFRSDLSVSSTYQLADTCQRTFTLFDGILMVGTVMILWPVLIFWLIMKAIG